MTTELDQYFTLAKQWRESIPADDPRRSSTVVTRPTSAASKAFLDAWAVNQVKQGMMSARYVAGILDWTVDDVCIAAFGEVVL